jgi:PTS system ascorbate-specific IIB component
MLLFWKRPRKARTRSRRVKIILKNPANQVPPKPLKANHAFDWIGHEANDLEHRRIEERALAHFCLVPAHLIAYTVRTDKEIAMRIVCVCGMGLGSSVIASMNVKDILKKLGIKAEVETCDLGSVRSNPADFFITTRELASNMPEEIKSKTVILTNFIKKADMEAALAPFLAGIVK